MKSISKSKVVRVVLSVLIFCMAVFLPACGIKKMPVV